MGTPKISKNIQILPRVDNYLKIQSEMMGLPQRVVVEGLVLGLQSAFTALKETYPQYSVVSIWKVLKQKIFDKTEPLYQVVESVREEGGITE